MHFCKELSASEHAAARRAHVAREKSRIVRTALLELRCAFDRAMAVHHGHRPDAGRCGQRVRAVPHDRGVTVPDAARATRQAADGGHGWPCGSRGHARRGTTRGRRADHRVRRGPDIGLPKTDEV